MHPLDPYRAATLLVRQMGPDAAEDHFHDRQVELLGEHDTAGAAAWMLVRLYTNKRHAMVKAARGAVTVCDIVALLVIVVTGSWEISFMESEYAVLLH